MQQQHPPSSLASRRSFKLNNSASARKLSFSSGGNFLGGESGSMLPPALSQSASGFDGGTIRRVTSGGSFSPRSPLRSPLHPPAARKGSFSVGFGRTTSRKDSMAIALNRRRSTMRNKRRDSDGVIRLTKAGTKAYPGMDHKGIDELPFMNLTDIQNLNDRVTGRHILKRRHNAFTLIRHVYWSVPITSEATQDLVDEFCGAHEVKPCDLEEITHATIVIRTALKKRSRLKETMLQFGKSLKVVQRALRVFIKKRRALLERLLEEWNVEEHRQRDELRAQISSRVSQLRPMKVVTMEALKRRPAVLNEDECSQFLNPLTPDDVKLNVIKRMLRRAMLAFHRRMHVWRRDHARRAELVRQKCLAQFGSILSYPLMLHRAGIPEQPTYSFKATLVEFQKELQRLQQDEEAKRVAAVEEELLAATAKQKEELEAAIFESTQRVWNRRRSGPKRVRLTAEDVEVLEDETDMGNQIAQNFDMTITWGAHTASKLVEGDKWMESCIREASPAPTGRSTAGMGSTSDGAARPLDFSPHSTMGTVASDTSPDKPNVFLTEADANRTAAQDQHPVDWETQNERSVSYRGVPLPPLWQSRAPGATSPEAASQRSIQSSSGKTPLAPDTNVKASTLATSYASLGGSRKKRLDAEAMTPQERMQNLRDSIDDLAGRPRRSDMARERERRGDPDTWMRQWELGAPLATKPEEAIPSGGATNVEDMDGLSAMLTEALQDTVPVFVDKRGRVRVAPGASPAMQQRGLSRQPHQQLTSPQTARSLPSSTPLWRNAPPSAQTPRPTTVEAPRPLSQAKPPPSAPNTPRIPPPVPSRIGTKNTISESFGVPESIYRSRRDRHLDYHDGKGREESSQRWRERREEEKRSLAQERQRRSFARGREASGGGPSAPGW